MNKPLEDDEMNQMTQDAKFWRSEADNSHDPHNTESEWTGKKQFVSLKSEYNPQTPGKYR